MFKLNLSISMASFALLTSLSALAGLNQPLTAYFDETSFSTDQDATTRAASVASMVQMKNIIPLTQQTTEADIESYLKLGELEPTRSNLKQLSKKYNKAEAYLLNITKATDAKYCSEFDFSDQVVLSNCTGSLIAPDVILTAGHCVKIKNFCKRFKWVFDYKYTKDGKIDVVRKKEQVYGCKKVLKKVQSNIPIYGVIFRPDVAIVELDRPVKDRKPLEIEPEFKPAAGHGLYAVSNPLGLPQKISYGQVTSKLTKSISMTDVPSFQGSSGAPVFSEESGKIVGLVVRGPEQMVVDQQRKCMKFKESSLENGKFTMGMSPLKKIVKRFNRFMIKGW